MILAIMNLYFLFSLKWFGIFNAFMDDKAVGSLWTPSVCSLSLVHGDFVAAFLCSSVWLLFHMAHYILILASLIHVNLVAVILLCVQI